MDVKLFLCVLLSYTKIIMSGKLLPVIFSSLFFGRCYDL